MFIFTSTKIGISYKGTKCGLCLVLLSRIRIGLVTGMLPSWIVFGVNPAGMLPGQSPFIFLCNTKQRPHYIYLNLHSSQAVH